MTIEKNYDPAQTEQKLYENWDKAGVFGCDVKSNKKPYTIMFPPPNVTGSLHMGHGLTFTIQDTLIRYRRMRGDDSLWQPGTDHAGIATQLVVERELNAHGKSRREMGREAFLEKVWEWKEQSGGTIINQLRRLGASADWKRERFTMDEGLSRAVRKVFVDLYREGYIYKDTRLVNWDPKMQTAVSDLEVEMREVRGNLWHFKYPVQGEENAFVIVATTRPETMFGDTAVAVHPDDPTKKHLIGKKVVLPIVGRVIPIVADEYADPEKGTGAVKITPAHDFNDYEVGRRHDLPMINVLDKTAHMNENAPEAYRGLDRFEARKKVVAEMDSLGLLDKVEPHVHTVPHDEKTKAVVIEPCLSEQWYCDAAKLAGPAIEAVEDGRVQFVPKMWENTYFAWMRSIEPWCISRQLWWGHQIPAWYGPDGKVFVAESEEEALAQAREAYGKDVPLRQDEDVLDTWFSSGLWPFSTLGWPDQTPELARYYPTDVLVTGFDIIFFWVARMMMLGMHFMKDVPFRKIYIHALVRDEKGQKMSKTKGNVIDPLDMINQYGCDALRFTLANLSTPGRDIRLAVSRIEGNRNFVTKIWNAARFCQMNGCKVDPAFDPSQVKLTLNRWIIGALKQTAEKMTSEFEAFRFDLLTNTAYDFVWGQFCDWYLEFTKPVLSEGDEAAQEETRATTAWVLGRLLTLLHPVMPYVTEELWKEFGDQDEPLIASPWPELGPDLAFTQAREEIDWLVQLISALRTIRAELNVPAKAEVKLLVKGASEQTKAHLATHAPVLTKMARLQDISMSEDVPQGAAQAVVGEATYILPLADIIDLDVERERLQRESAKWQKELEKIQAKLANESFVSRAPEDVVEEHKTRAQEAKQMVAKLQEAASRLAG